MSKKFLSQPWKSYLLIILGVIIAVPVIFFLLHLATIILEILVIILIVVTVPILLKIAQVKYQLRRKKPKIKVK